MQLLPHHTLHPLCSLPCIFRDTTFPSLYHDPICQRLQRITLTGWYVGSHSRSGFLGGELAVVGGAGVAEGGHLDVGFGEAGGVVGGPADEGRVVDLVVLVLVA